MSFESWKEEFYPMPAEEVRPERALEHSLQKWKGLRPENLKKHGVVYDKIRQAVLDPDHPEADHPEGEDRLCIDGDSCALCVHNHDTDDTLCESCPFYKARGNVACDSARKDEDIDQYEFVPYFAMTKRSNPEPMIRWLTLAQDVEDNSDESEINHEMECGK